MKKKWITLLIIFISHFDNLMPAEQHDTHRRRFESAELDLYKPIINSITYRKLVPDESQFKKNQIIYARISYPDGKKTKKRIHSLKKARELIEQAIRENKTVTWYYESTRESE